MGAELLRVPSAHTTRGGAHFNGDEDDDHPLQPQAVLLAQVAPHQVRQLSAVLQLLVHNLRSGGQRHRAE